MIAAANTSPLLPTVLLVDDNTQLAGSFERYIGATGTARWLGWARSLAEARTVIAGVADKPDVIVMESSIGGEPSLSLAQWIAGHAPASRVVVLTGRIEAGEVRGFLGAGVAGILSKGADPREIAASLRSVHDGHLTICAAAALAISAVTDDTDAAALPRWGRV